MPSKNGNQRNALKDFAKIMLVNKHDICLS